MDNLKQITVTSPLFLPLEGFTPHLEDIWGLSVMNNGSYMDLPVSEYR